MSRPFHPLKLKGYDLPDLLGEAGATGLVPLLHPPVVLRLPRIEARSDILPPLDILA